MLIAQRRHEAVVVAARVLFVARSALLLKDCFAELYARAVGRFRSAQGWQVTQVGSNVGHRLRLVQRRPADDRVHLLTLTLQFGEIRKLLDQIGLALRGQSRNHVTRIADSTLTVTAGAVL